MTEETKKLPVNMLTAEELLKNKGLKYYAWDEFEKSTKTLPRTGMKQFEPNNSWLQNMQLEKGITTRKNLIAVERVDRISQLAHAEWLPVQKRAKVTKYSGQDWSSFGLERNGALYLIPEEALFLLEANCLELTWNDVPLSIQQAYDVLIDNIECSLEEYRVYSQLIRYGYHIQRFIYNSEKSTKYDENTSTKRKLIIEPENGLWMVDIQEQNKDCTDTNKKAAVPEKVNADINSSIEVSQNEIEHSDIATDVHKILNNLLNEVEQIEIQPESGKCKSNVKYCTKSNTDQKTVNTNENKKKRNGRAEIISDETLLGNIKVVNWRSSRIQRNVKLLPKRTDKVLSNSDVCITDSNIKTSEHSLGKHKPSSLLKEDTQIKKSKQEVIELSDDEVQEIPKPMSRMDLLNLIPNIAVEPTITIKISRGYIPHNVKPRRTVYHYETAKLRNLQQTDKGFRSKQNAEHSNANQKALQCYNTFTNNSARRNTNIMPFNQNLANVQNVFMQNYFSMQQGQHTNFSPAYACINRLPYNQNFYWHHRNTTFQNMFVAVSNHGTAIHQNRSISVQMNNMLLPHAGNNPLNSIVRNQGRRHLFYPNVLPSRNSYHHRVIENMSVHFSVGRNTLLPESRQRFWSRNHQRTSNTVPKHDEAYQSSFKALPGVSSWSELKAKWREEKTITIDDEDTEKDQFEDDNDVQVIDLIRSPLVGPKNAKSLEEVFSKLKIIKSAPEKTVRRKKSKYKISYNVYSNTQNYRKANPGLPLYRVVVVRQDDPFIQPIELHRLTQDAGNSQIVLACVSMSISYIQPGFISVHNLI